MRQVFIRKFPFVRAVSILQKCTSYDKLWGTCGRGFVRNPISPGRGAPVPAAGSTDTQLGPRAPRPLCSLLWDLRGEGGKKQIKSNLPGETHADTSSLGNVDASSFLNAFCNVVLRCAWDVDAWDVKLDPNWVGMGIQAGQLGVLPGRGTRNQRVFWPMPRAVVHWLWWHSWGWVAPSQRSPWAQALWREDTPARGSHLDIFARFHKTNTPTEQLGCVIWGFADPFLSLPPNPLLAAACGSLQSFSKRCW